MHPPAGAEPEPDQDRSTAWPGRDSPLGARCDEAGTNFALWSSAAEAVDLCLFDDAGRESRLPLVERRHGVWHGYVRGITAGQRYGYRVHGPWNPWRGQRFNSAKLLLDPYARAVDGDLVLDDAVFGHLVGSGHDVDDTVRDDRDSAPYVPRSVVVESSFDWARDRHPQTPWADTIVYEAHVRGLTRLHPGVPPRLRGTYAGLAHPAVLEHLTRLGVTAVELLPVHHFSSEPLLTRRGLRNYWGYNSIGFFAPHAAYSSAGGRGEQVEEFKAMVRELHAAGLEVLLDVVYNHTAESSEIGPTLSFRGIDNAGYYRLRQGRYYVDVTGCGNSVNLTQPAPLRLVADSLRYWVEEMHVDGFRFDLAPELARGREAEAGFDARAAFFAVLQQDPVLSRVKLIAEPWDIGPDPYHLGAFPAPFAEWNDKYRDAVRDFWLSDNARDASSGVRALGYGLSGSSNIFSADRGPLASVNFVTAHDGFTLRDTTTYEHKHNRANGENNRDGTDDNHSWNCGIEGETDDPAVLALRRRLARAVLATLLISTGVPMLTAGDEIGRTQRGNNNAYCRDDDVSWVDWGLAPWQEDLLETTRALIRLRREHPVFRQGDFFDGRPVHEAVKDVAWFRPDGSEMTPDAWFEQDRRTLGIYLSGDGITTRDAHGGRVRDESFLVLCHGGREETAFRLPAPPWATAYARVVDTDRDRPGDGKEIAAGADLRLAPLSVVVLAVRR